MLLLAVACRKAVRGVRGSSLPVWYVEQGALHTSLGTIPQLPAVFLYMLLNMGLGRL